MKHFKTLRGPLVLKKYIVLTIDWFLRIGVGKHGRAVAARGFLRRDLRAC
jgi:hypothetical protein